MFNREVSPLTSDIQLFCSDTVLVVILHQRVVSSSHDEEDIRLISIGFLFVVVVGVKTFVLLFRRILLDRLLPH